MNEQEEFIKKLEINAAIIKYKELIEFNSHEDVLKMFESDGGIMKAASEIVISEKLLSQMQHINTDMDGVYNRMFVEPEEVAKRSLANYLKLLKYAQSVEEFLEENDAVFDNIQHKFKKEIK